MWKEPTAVKGHYTGFNLQLPTHHFTKDMETHLGTFSVSIIMHTCENTHTNTTHDICFMYRSFPAADRTAGVELCFLVCVLIWGERACVSICVCVSNACAVNVVMYTHMHTYTHGFPACVYVCQACCLCLSLCCSFVSSFSVSLALCPFPKPAVALAMVFV